MDNQTTRVVAQVDFGSPPSSSRFQRWEQIDVRFHGFKDIPNGEGHGGVFSPEFTCLGHRWSVSIFPPNNDIVVDDDVGIYLDNISDEAIKIDCSFTVRDPSGKEAGFIEGPNKTFARNGIEGDYGSPDYYWGDEFPRSAMLKALINGSLVVEVRMRKTGPSTNPGEPFVPENPICKNILKKFLDEKSADVIFDLGGGSEQRNKKPKRAKTSTATDESISIPTATTFHAHHLILQDGAPMLAELCTPSGRDNQPTISITDVKPNIFQHMLYYIYGGKLSDKDLEANAKDLIDVSDKYGVVNLKLQAEAFYVKSTKLAIDNVLDNLLYAYSKNCALLKEAVMDFIVENSDDIMGEVSFHDCPGCAMTDLVAAMARGKKKGGDNASSSKSSNFNNMKVATLRRMLHEKGLEVDGSRESMISLLKENS